ncbi:MAG: rhomboid family intramembrane serine protease, partial [Muribaculaceae bacterium]|nr:rhomboid family intramembrane serine protease [Muribaculaceae bacterium]
PDMPMYLFFIPVPIKAKYMVLGYGVLEFFLGVTRSADTVAHFAHLGGLIFGLIILLYWRKKGTLRGGYF